MVPVPFCIMISVLQTLLLMSYSWWNVLGGKGEQGERGASGSPGYPGKPGLQGM